jgi:hypothetical protein
MLLKSTRHGIDRKLLTLIAVILMIVGLVNTSIASSAVGDDQVYTGDSKDDPKDDSSDYSDQ